MLTVEIIVTGRIDPEWSDWLGGLAVTHCESGQAVLSGLLTDQSAVYGVIARLRDLGLPLTSLKVKENV